MTKPQINKKPGDEKAAASSSHRPATETGVEIGMPLFLQGLALSTNAPDRIQRQPIEEEEELIQPKSVSASIQRQPIEEEEEEPVQTKLTVADPNDEYEREADQVAEQVMRIQEDPGQ